MYNRILVGLDGSDHSNLAAEAAIALASNRDSKIIGCHVYAAQLHRSRFEEMEPGLPERYQEEDRLNKLRGTHEEIISGGMKLISDAYLASLEQEAKENGIEYSSSTPEGRNYVKFLEVAKTSEADLVVLGAQGQGQVPESVLGSLTERSLLSFDIGDIMITRRPWRSKGPVVVGVDGSPSSYEALDRAIDLSLLTGSAVEAVAVYDPFFHTGVFQTISQVLSEEGKQRFNFAAQQRLHDELIDEGLASLYKEGLERGVALGQERGVEVKAVLLTGKVYAQLHHYAEARNASMIIMGRYGLHHQDGDLIGSNALNVARIAFTNVIVVSGHERVSVPSVPGPTVSAMIWSPEAEKLLDNVPPFARGAARRGIEARVRERGGDKVDAIAVREVAEAVGMGERLPSIGDMAEVSAAEYVILRKNKRFAPDFHRHIVTSKMIGAEIKAGDQFMVYEVVETRPSGRVKVTDNTRLEFR